MAAGLLEPLPSAQIPVALEAIGPRFQASIHQEVVGGNAVGIVLNLPAGEETAEALARVAQAGPGPTVLVVVDAVDQAEDEGADELVAVVDADRAEVETVVSACHPFLRTDPDEVRLFHPAFGRWLLAGGLDGTSEAAQHLVMARALTAYGRDQRWRRQVVPYAADWTLQHWVNGLLLDPFTPDRADVQEAVVGLLEDRWWGREARWTMTTLRHLTDVAPHTPCPGRPGQMVGVLRTLARSVTAGRLLQVAPSVREAAPVDREVAEARVLLECMLASWVDLAESGGWALTGPGVLAVAAGRPPFTADPVGGAGPFTAVLAAALQKDPNYLADVAAALEVARSTVTVEQDLVDRQARHRPARRQRGRPERPRVAAGGAGRRGGGRRDRRAPGATPPRLSRRCSRPGQALQPAGSSSVSRSPSVACAAPSLRGFSAAVTPSCSRCRLSGDKVHPSGGATPGVVVGATSTVLPPRD